MQEVFSIFLEFFYFLPGHIVVNGVGKVAQGHKRLGNGTFSAVSGAPHHGNKSAGGKTQPHTDIEILSVHTNTSFTRLYYVHNGVDTLL